ncbi:MRH4 [Sanghuangporus sanghuang]
MTAAAQKTKRPPKGRANSKGSSRSQFKPTSRTRLAADLKPDGKGGKYEVAKTEARKTPNTKVENAQASTVNARESIEALLDEEFDRSTPMSEEKLPNSFSSPLLLPALTQSMADVLGANAAPTPIQGLALKHLMSLAHARSWQEFLLASETGSGKSFAYLLPLIQYLKETEEAAINSTQRLPINPRALVLAPTHELSRQLSVFAKSLIHYAKIRVLCASRANVPTTIDRRTVSTSSAREMKHLIDSLESKLFATEGAAQTTSTARPVDLLVSTPVKALEMVRGWGWDKVGKEESNWGGKKFRPGKPEMGLKRIECVVVDEADILFDPDFRDSTLGLLSDISAARGHPVSTDARSTKYPFHLILTSATIPASLSTYLSTHHPTLTRLASPHLHQLPATLHTEHIGWTGGNRFADIEKRLRQVWAEDALRGPNQMTGRIERSRVLVFCNRSTTVDALGAHLTERGIPNVTLTSTGPSRARGSNRHLAGFLKGTAVSGHESTSIVDKDTPHVLITTSLLSRGLDFSPSVQHVFIVDSPRNMIDFLHRAGRSGRAGQLGKVVIFGKLKGRGSEMDKGLKSKVRALAR